MRIKISFFVDVPEGYSVRNYSSAVQAVRRALAFVGLDTSVWRIEYIDGKKTPAINSNGPTGSAS